MLEALDRKGEMLTAADRRLGAELVKMVAEAGKLGYPTSPP
jgi:hypothetical protein